MFCKNCGKEIEEDVKFCPECGTNQSKSGSLNIQEDKEFDTNGSEKPLNDDGLTVFDLIHKRLPSIQTEQLRSILTHYQNKM